MTRSAPTFALVLDYLVSSYQVGLTRAIERITKDRGVNLLTFIGRAFNPSSAADTAQNRIYELITNQTVDGIIVLSGCVSHHFGPDGLASYCARYRPIPICSIGIELPQIPSLIISNEQGSRAVVEHLIVRHGASRIAYVGGPIANREAVDRYQGFKAGLGRHGLALHDNLVDDADFSLPGGEAAMKRILSRSTNFDAVVAANDYMALGAMNALRAHGIRVPNDVRVAGFDDVQLSRFSFPALTTVRQPLEALARRAVESLLEAVQGKGLPLLSAIDVEVVTRSSCGCAETGQRRNQSLLPENSRPDVTFSVMRHRDTIIKSLQSTVGIPVEALGGWAGRLLDALHVDLTSRVGRFLEVFTAMLEEAESQPGTIDELGKVVAQLRSELKRLRPMPDIDLELEHIWYGAQVAVGNAVTNVQGREKMELQVTLGVVRDGFERIGTASSRSTLHQGISEMLCDLQIRRASVTLVDEHYPDRLVPFVTMTGRGAAQAAETGSFSETQLVPLGFWGTARHSHIVMPLSFDGDYFGVLVMEYTANETVFGLMRDHISSALKTMALRDVALRERVQRERIEDEQRIAKRLQTAILEHPPRFAGYQLAASMSTASETSYGYYDAIAVERGGWVSVGGVRGRQLLGGLVTRMLQGMVAALVHRTPRASPAELMGALDRALFEHLRNRLELEDDPSLVMLRLDDDGSVVCAGRCDNVLVWRKASRRAEPVLTTRVDSGTETTVLELTQDALVQLQVGDVLLLFSDGVANACNELGEHFDRVRIRSILETVATHPVEKIDQAIVRAVEQWQTRHKHESTVVALRYEGRQE